MPARQKTVVEVGDRQDDRAADREYPVSNDAKRIMRDGRAEAEQGEARDSAQHDAHIAVPGEPGTDCQDAQGNHDEQHLDVQMRIRERQQDR